MPIQTSAAGGAGAVALSNSTRTQYLDQYAEEVYFSRYYDQLAIPMGRDMAELIRGSAVQANFISKMAIGTSAISETADITPQALRDAVATITPTSRGEAIQTSQQIQIRNFLNDYMEKLVKTVAEGAAETIDVLARDAATQGTLVNRTAARASLDAGTTSHRLTETKFANAANQLGDLKAPMFEGMSDGGQQARRWSAMIDPFAFADLRQDGSVQAVGQYQQAGIHLNWELGELGPFRLLVSSWAKILYGAGLDAVDITATTLNTAVNPLATSLRVAANTHMDQTEAAGQWLNIGTEETANTHYPQNERVRITGFTGSTATIVGQGPNGGLRFAHPATNSVRNADSVHLVVFGGPGSLLKLYAPEVGEFGEIVGPKRDGILDQFWTLGFKFWGGYGRIAENRLLREEVSVAQEAWS